MSNPRKVTQEEYDEFRSNMEAKYNYDEMSDEEKERFDEKIDQVAVVGEDNTDDVNEESDEDVTDATGDDPEIGQRERDRGEEESYDIER